MFTPVKPDIKQQTISGVGWSAGARIAKQILQFIISVILARLLTPEDFGLVGMIAVFTGFAALFGELGFGAALIQRQDVEEQHYSSIFWLNLLSGFILMGVVIAAAPAIAAFYNEPRLVPLTMLIAVNFLIGALNIVQQALLTRALNFQKLAFIETISMLMAGSVAIVLAYLGYGVYALVWQMLISTMAGVILMWNVTGWYPHLIFSWQSARELLGFSSNLLGFNVFNYWVRGADNLLIGKFIGSGGLGIYTRAYSTMLLPLNQVSAVVGRVMFPALARIQDDKPRIKRIYLQAISMISLITFPMMLGLLVVSKSFVLALYGPQWAAVVPILQILCLVGLAQSVGTTTGWIYQSQGRTDWLFYWGIASGIVTFIAFGVGIIWGVLGVTIAYAIRTFMLTFFNFAIPGKLIDMTFSEVVRSVAGIFGCAAVMALLVWGVGLLLPAGWPHWAYLVVQVPVGVLVYGGLVHLFKLRAYRDVRGLVAEQRGRYRRGRQLEVREIIG